MEDRPAVTQAATDAQQDATEDLQGANIKETIESILVAFILAFIFRCFVVEAFVIPTGSMAPALLGAHSHYVCPDCGYQFDANFSSRTGKNGEDTEIPDRAGYFRSRTDPKNPKADIITWEDETYSDIRCPNCGYHHPTTTNTPVLYGDRILVLKYAYLLEKPKRWDVVVFKSPQEREQGYTVNYIKRLTGRPGETIMVLDGDVYVKAKGGKDFKVQSKPREAQDALWRIVYDDDHRPADLVERTAPWQQPWQQTDGDGWDTAPKSGRHIFGYKGTTAATLNFNPNPSEDGNYGFRDWLAYDQRHSASDDRGYTGRYPVSDLKLDLVYSHSSGDGPLKLLLTKLDDRFTAEITRGQVKLIHESPIHPTSTVTAAIAASDLMHIEFTNVDYRVCVRINDKDVLVSTPEDYHPDVDDLIQRSQDYMLSSQYSSRVDNSRRFKHNPPLPLPMASITAERQQCELSHVSLWRDVYYTSFDSNNQYIHWGAPGDAPATEEKSGPIQLGDDEYFVMGDNSPLSLDARFWTKPIELKDEGLQIESGRVPGRFLLGRAFFVYWPAGFRPTEKAPGLIPNFGQMRFIK